MLRGQAQLPRIPPQPGHGTIGMGQRALCCLLHPADPADGSRRPSHPTPPDRPSDRLGRQALGMIKQAAGRQQALLSHPSIRPSLALPSSFTPPALFALSPSPPPLLHPTGTATPPRPLRPSVAAEGTRLALHLYLASQKHASVAVPGRQARVRRCCTDDHITDQLARGSLACWHRAECTVVRPAGWLHEQRANGSARDPQHDTTHCAFRPVHLHQPLRLSCAAPACCMSGLGRHALITHRARQ